MANTEEFNDDAELDGFMADPNAVDPVSGNEIPLGATAEGVRDDQTAAISPGEFVIPDYAVRYHGLDFYVGSLQKAKQGLGQMEGMGLVGNPDEQTIPDETPLPTMDEKEEYQTGGLITTPLQTVEQQQLPTTPIPPPPVIEPLDPLVHSQFLLLLLLQKFLPKLLLKLRLILYWHNISRVTIWMWVEDTITTLRHREYLQQVKFLHRINFLPVLS